MARKTGFSTTLVGIRANNGKGTFGKVKFSQTLMQLPSYYFIRLGSFTDVHSDIEYFADLAGKSLGPGPSGTSYWPVFGLALQKTLNLDELEVLYSSLGRLSNLLSAGQAIAVGGPTLSNNVTPGFMQQVCSRSDVRMLSYRDKTLQAIQDDPKIPIVNVKKSKIPNVTEFTASGDTIPMVSANYVAWSSDAVSKESIYNIYKTAWNNKETLSESHAAFKLWSAKEWFTQNMTTEVPVHPGAVKFLKELGVWSDKYTEGSIYGDNAI